MMKTIRCQYQPHNFRGGCAFDVNAGASGSKRYFFFFCSQSSKYGESGVPLPFATGDDKESREREGKKKVRHLGEKPRLNKGID